MPTIPMWLIGRQVTVLTLTAQDVSAAGVLSNNIGGAKDIKVRLNAISLSMDVETEEINSVVSDRVHNVILANAQRLTLEEILVNDGSSAVSHLADFALAFDVGKVIFTRGAKTWTVYGMRGAYSESVNSRGKVVATLELIAVDTGNDEVTYA